MSKWFSCTYAVTLIGLLIVGCKADREVQSVIQPNQIQNPKSHSEIIDSAGNIIVIQVLEHEGDQSDLRVAKYDVSGELLWVSEYVTAIEGIIVIDSLDNIYAVYFSPEEEEESIDVLVQKMSKDGDLEWSEDFEVSGDNNSIEVELDGEDRLMIGDVLVNGEEDD